MNNRISTILTPESDIQTLVLKLLEPIILHLANNYLDNSERQRWKKLHELVSNYRIVLKIKSIPPSIITRKQQRSDSQPPNEHVPQQQHPTRYMAINVTNETLTFIVWLKLFLRLPIIFHRQISVFDIIVDKPQASTYLQTRRINLILSVVTNMDTTTMDVPLRPQEVHDLISRAGRLITSYVREFLPNDTQQTSSIQTTANTDNKLINTSLNDTIEEPHIPIPLEQTTTKKRLSTRRNDTINRTINPLNSDNYIRIDFPEIRWYGNYSIQQEQENKTKGGLNLRTKIDVLKLTITADFLAQLVFVLKVIIHEINEILAKVSGFDQFHFGTTKDSCLSSSSTVPIIRIGSTDTENEDDDERGKDQPTIPSTLFTY
ncbi:unnamed protein product [Adineta steineri]|uniref:Uncharacterized protein n=1 Tax=Adineta steineri TaxID=433720 RepID=A0A815SQ01_9BILA|nr:unnamed protein product [Adineta steineri]CAF1642490.1 unnamed protein product [Adineta steineri]